MSDAGQLIKRMVALSGDMAALNKAVKDKRKEIEDLKVEIRAALNAQGLHAANDGEHSVSIKEEFVPQAKNWDELFEYIYDNRYIHLLNRRLTSESCRELWALGTTIPGVEQFKTFDISLRKV